MAVAQKEIQGLREEMIYKGCAILGSSRRCEGIGRAFKTRVECDHRDASGTVSGHLICLALWLSESRVRG